MKNNGKPMHPISKLRKEKKLSQNEFGVLVGQSGMRIAQFEGGYQPVPFSVYYKIFECFEIPPEDFQQEVDQYNVEYREYLIANKV